VCKQYLPGGSGEVGGINFGDPADLFGGQKRRDAASQQAEAKRLEAERHARISGNVKNINSAFDGRAPQYAQLGEALRERLNTELAHKRGEATRQNKFALARSGLTGGSAAIDAGRLLSRESREGALAAERQAQAGVADLMGKDEQARLSLISLAQSGNDIGNAGAQAASMLRANLSGAQNTDMVNGLGNVFAGTGEAVKNQRDAAARRRGLTDASAYAKPFSRG
jgi:hypothetical protein